MLFLPRKYALTVARDGEALGALLGPLIIVALILIIWLSVKIVNLLFRVFVHYPRCKWLWIGVGFVVIALAAAVVTHWQSLSTTLLILSFLTLLIIAKFIDLYNSHLLQEQTTTVEKVLRRPWWQANTNTTLAA